MQTQRHRIISGLLIVAMVAVVAAGWLLVASPQVAAAQAAEGQVSAAQAQLTASEAAVAQLRGQKSKLPELTQQLEQLRASIPSDIESADFLTQLASEASAAGVTITSVSVSDPTAYAPPAATPAAGAGAANASGASASPSPSPSATGAPAATSGPSSAWAPATDSAITAANFATIPVALKFTGSWDAVRAFLASLQTGPRLYLVTKLSTMAKADGSGSIDASTDGFAYAIYDAAKAASMTGLDTKKAKATPAPKPTATPSTPAEHSGTPTPSATPDPSKTPSGGGGSTPGA